MVEAKSKKRLRESRHKLAIAGFVAWLDQHPDATRGEKVKEFDKQCDMARKLVKAA